MARVRETSDASEDESMLDLIPRWLPWAVFSLCLGGIAAAAYLFYAHLTDPAVLVCPENGAINCAKVTTSAQSRFIGIPVSFLGLAFFVVYAAINYPRFFASRLLGMLRFLMAIGAMAFVLWLVYAELLIVNAICLWCSAVHVITLLSFLLVLYASIQTGVLRRTH